MMSAGRGAGWSRGVVSLGLGDPDCVIKRVAEFGQFVRQIFNVIGDEMDDDALALKSSSDLQEPSSHDRAAKAGVDLGPDHDIGNARFVLKRQKDHARGRAGALASDDEAAHRGAFQRRCWQAVMWREIRDRRA